MLKNSLEAPEIIISSANRAEKSRKPYSKPKLMELGDLRDLTLGGTAGTGDSGGGGASHKHL
jgi:hypothetical protein